MKWLVGKKFYLNCLIALVFLVTSCVGALSHGEVVGKTFHLVFENTKLAPPSGFQDDISLSMYETFTGSFSRDIRLLTVAISVSYHLWLDGGTKDSLEKTIRDKFRSNLEFLDNILLGEVQIEDSSVMLPYEVGKAKYFLRVELRKKDFRRDPGNILSEIENFNVSVVSETGARASKEDKNRIKKVVSLKSPSGLHSGVALNIVEEARKFPGSKIYLHNREKRASALSVTELMSLRARDQGKITISGEGSQGRDAVEMISRILQHGDIRDKGSHFSCLAAIFSSEELRGKQDISVTELLEVRRPWKRSTIQLEVRMLKALGLLSPGKTKHTFTLAPKIKDLDKQIQVSVVDEIIEFLYTLPAKLCEDIAQHSRDEIEKIILRGVSYSRAKERLKNLKYEPVRFRIPDASHVSLRKIIEEATDIEKYYRDTGKCSLYGDKKRQAYFMGYAGVIFKEPGNEVRLIKHEKVNDPEGKYQGDIVVYFDKKESAVTINMFGPDRYEPISSSQDVRRGDRSWDMASIKVYLDQDLNISMIHHITSEMGLSRTCTAIMLRDSGFEKNFPDLFQAVKEYLVLPDADFLSRMRERIDNRVVPFRKISKIGENDDDIREEEIRFIENIVFYKSRSVREIALNKLRKMAASGHLDKERMIRNESLFELYNIEEDITFVKREMFHQPRIIKDISENLYHRRVSPDEVDEIVIRWYGAGKNKNVYRGCLVLDDGQEIVFAVSTIRNDPVGSGFSSRKIRSAQKKWGQMKQSKINNIAVLVSDIWAKDFRPRVSDYPVLFRSEIRGFDDVGRQKWIHNDINLVFREFVEGKDLQEIIADENMGEQDKGKAVIKALQAYLDLWNETKDDNGKGLFIGDPKPANIVLRDDDGFSEAKIIDFDAICYVKGIGEIKRLLSGYPEYSGVVIGVVDGMALAGLDMLEKNIPEDMYLLGSKNMLLRNLIEKLYVNERFSVGVDILYEDIIGLMPGIHPESLYLIMNNLVCLGFLHRQEQENKFRINKALKETMPTSLDILLLKLDILAESKIDDTFINRTRAEIESLMIHKLNMLLHASIHLDIDRIYLIHEELIPVSMRNDLLKLIRRIRRKYPHLREEIRVVNDRHLKGGIENFLKNIDSTGDKRNIFLASPSKELLKRCGVRGIVFKGDVQAELVHIEGILASLRALASDEYDILIKLYELLTGSSFGGSKTDLMGGKIIFKLRPIEKFDDIWRLKLKFLQYVERSA